MPIVKVKLDEVRVLDESNEWSGSDEPYFIIYTADRTTREKDGSLRQKITAHGWSDADEGELLSTLTSDEVPKSQQDIVKSLIGFDEYCWGPSGKAVNVIDADDLVILVGALELDAGTVKEARKTAAMLMFDAAITSTDWGAPRAELVKELKHSLNRALGLASIKRGGIDDRIGKVREVRFTDSDFEKVLTKRVRKNITIDGGDSEGAYRLGFDLIRG